MSCLCVGSAREKTRPPEPPRNAFWSALASLAKAAPVIDDASSGGPSRTPMDAQTASAVSLLSPVMTMTREVWGETAAIPGNNRNFSVGLVVESSGDGLSHLLSVVALEREAPGGRRTLLLAPEQVVGADQAEGVVDERVRFHQEELESRRHEEVASLTIGGNFAVDDGENQRAAPVNDQRAACVLVHLIGSLLRVCDSDDLREQRDVRGLGSPQRGRRRESHLDGARLGALDLHKAREEGRDAVHQVEGVDEAGVGPAHCGRPELQGPEHSGVSSLPRGLPLARVEAGQLERWGSPDLDSSAPDSGACLSQGAEMRWISPGLLRSPSVTERPAKEITTLSLKPSTMECSTAVHRRADPGESASTAGVGGGGPSTGG